MGGVTGMLGIGPNPGQQGLGYSPGAASIQSPVTPEQAQAAQAASLSGIKNQSDFLAALQAQNGIGNQSSVFNQLQGVANGTGPNPAQAMLANATGANTANQAALMAGQRGAGANTGLIARQAAQQGGANQMNAAGQGAAMQAQQSLGALNQLGGIAGQQVGQQANATGALTGAQQQQQSMLLNSIAGVNSANVGMKSNQNAVSGNLAQEGAKQQGQLIGGVINGIGGGLFAKGGEVPHYDGGGTVQGAPQAPAAPTNGPKSNLGKGMAAMGTAMTPSSNEQNQGAFMAGSTIGKGIGSGLKNLFGSSSGGQPSAALTQGANDYESDAGAPDFAAGEMYAHGGKVPAMVSPGERYLPPKEVEKVAKGKNPLKAGEKIPGKAKVKGDSLKNDTVPKTLEEGGIVLPKSVMESKHPHWEAHKFVSAILAKNKGLKRG